MLLSLLDELPQLLWILLLYASQEILSLQWVDIGQTLRVFKQVGVAPPVVASRADAWRFRWNLGVLELVKDVALCHRQALSSVWQKVDMAGELAPDHIVPLRVVQVGIAGEEVLS